MARRVPRRCSEIRRAVKLLILPGQVVEMRALGAERSGTISGYFDADHHDELVMHAPI